MDARLVGVPQGDLTTEITEAAENRSLFVTAPAAARARRIRDALAAAGQRKKDPLKLPLSAFSALSALSAVNEVAGARARRITRPPCPL